MKNGKQVAATKSPEQTDRQLSDEEEEKREDEDYDILDANGEYGCEQPGANVIVSETDSREELVIPMINEEPEQFWHVTIPPGKRHLIQVLVATPRVALSWKFTTEKKVNTSPRIAYIDDREPRTAPGSRMFPFLAWFCSSLRTGKALVLMS